MFRHILILLVLLISFRPAEATPVADCVVARVTRPLSTAEDARNLLYGAIEEMAPELHDQMVLGREYVDSPLAKSLAGVIDSAHPGGMPAEIRGVLRASIKTSGKPMTIAVTLEPLNPQGTLSSMTTPEALAGIIEGLSSQVAKIERDSRLTGTGPVDKIEIHLNKLEPTSETLLRQLGFHVEPLPQPKKGFLSQFSKPKKQTSPASRDFVWTIVTATDQADAADAAKLKDIVARKGREEGSAYKFRTNRDLESYFRNFFKLFKKRLRSLGPNGRWLDAGSGDGNAAADFVSDEKFRGQAVGVALEKPAPKNRAIESKFPDRLRFLHGRFFEDIPDEELGKFDVITDPMGISSYTATPDETLAKYFRILNKDGEIYIYTGNGPEPASFVTTKSGVRMTLLDWITQQENITVDWVRRTGQSVRLRVKDPSRPVRIRRLKLLSTDESTIPPTRYFEQLDDSIDIAAP